MKTILWQDHAMPDNLTRAQRSKCMSSVRTRDTDIEAIVCAALRRHGLRFKRHAKLPGKPDIVFAGARLTVFIDGDFWHGYRFPAWQDRLSGFWRKKIATNRSRDQRNFRKLRRQGWRVLRLWQHEIRRDVMKCVVRVQKALR